MSRIKSKIFDKIFVKMDIEGGELDLLESLIDNNAVANIDTLYVEFHSQYQATAQSLTAKEREEQIIFQLKRNRRPKLRIWH